MSKRASGFDSIEKAVSSSGQILLVHSNSSGRLRTHNQAMEQECADENPALKSANTNTMGK